MRGVRGLQDRSEWEVHRIQIEALVPVRVQGSLGYGGGLGLLAIDGSHGKRVGETCHPERLARLRETS